MHTAFSGIEPLKVSGRTDFAAFTPPKGLSCHATGMALLLALDEGYHGIAATDGESADFEKSYEEVAIFYHFYRFRVADGRQAVCVPQK